MNCLILEDEPLAINVIKDYISDIPGLELKSICVNVPEALNALRNHNIDILFVDINLPKVNGLDFIKTLKANYHVILTTAHHEFALDGYDLNVVDYLLKPIEFSRFLQAVNKVFDRITTKQHSDKTVNSDRKYLFLNVEKKQVKVFLDEILYIESLKDYVKIHLTDRQIITKFQIGELSSILEKDVFIRIHKSFIININKVSAISASEIEIGKISLPIGRTYKDEIEPIISSNINNINRFRNKKNEIPTKSDGDLL